MMSHEVAWRGMGDVTRLDVVSIDFDPWGGFVATGRQSTQNYRAQWDLVIDAQWRTKLLTIDVEGYKPMGSDIDIVVAMLQQPQIVTSTYDAGRAPTGRRGAAGAAISRPLRVYGVRRA